MSDDVFKVLYLGLLLVVLTIGLSTCQELDFLEKQVRELRENHIHPQEKQP